MSGPFSVGVVHPRDKSRGRKNALQQRHRFFEIGRHGRLYAWMTQKHLVINEFMKGKGSQIEGMMSSRAFVGVCEASRSCVKGNSSV